MHASRRQSTWRPAPIRPRASNRSTHSRPPPAPNGPRVVGRERSPPMSSWTSRTSWIASWTRCDVTRANSAPLRIPGPCDLWSSALHTGVASPTCRRPRHSRSSERAGEHGEALAGRFDRCSVPAPVAERTAGARLRRGCRRVGKRDGLRGDWNSLLAIFVEPMRRPAAATGVTIFQNPDDRASFRRHRLVRPGRDALVLGSGIDFTPLQVDGAAVGRLRRELSLEGRLVVTMISRLVAQKGVRDFIHAAALVRQQRPDSVFLLIGPASSEGRGAVSSREVERSARDGRYLGPRSDVSDLLALSDLFVLPTYLREGIPRVLLDAAALGLPLVTTDTPGCKEIVRDGWNGLLVPPQDPRRLAAAVLRLLASPDERKLMGSRSRTHVTGDFSLRYF